MKHKKTHKPKTILKYILVFLLGAVLSYWITSYGIDTFTTEDQNIASQNQQIEELQRLIRRECGDLPEKYTFPRVLPSDDITGPGWSPNCQHIAYGLSKFPAKSWESGEGSASPEHSGIYLVDIDNDLVEKVVSLSDPEGRIEFIGWTDQDTFMYAQFSHSPYIKEILEYKVSDM